GSFCDPQLGCSNKYLAVDLVRAKSSQWSQEMRLQSSFAGKLNFNVGVNYLKFDVDEDYFLFSNTFSLIASVINGGVLRASPDVPPSDLC
ncbi:hypothetical protein, partial [Escherichia coli]